MFFLSVLGLVTSLMACVDGPQPRFKHYCRVCKKGFMCGRALGGHMRAHGIGDENGNLDDDDDNASDWEDKFGADQRNSSSSSKRMYQLRTNPNRLKSCRTCENCGKEFLSWKSFLEHGNGKCSSDDVSESLVSSPDSDEGGGRRGGGWSKRKRSLRSTYTSTSEEEDLLLATCLVQLANTTVDLAAEESSASAGKEAYLGGATPKKGASSPRGLFECKACGKVFNSHQALGGHRASHKKVKGCYAAKQEENDNLDVINSDKDVAITATNTDNDPPFHLEPPLVGAARRKSKVHECSICHRVFNSGQALGGHKRCHWIISNSPETSSLPKFQFQEQQIKPSGSNADVMSEKLDLNVPAWAQMAGVRRDPRNPLSFDVSTDMQLQPWIGHEVKEMSNTNNKNKKKDEGRNESEKGKVEDEADSKMKLAKLSDLNDEKVGAPSQWLQVGIGTSSNVAAQGDV